MFESASQGQEDFLFLRGQRGRRGVELGDEEFLEHAFIDDQLAGFPSDRCRPPVHAVDGDHSAIREPRFEFIPALERPGRFGKPDRPASFLQDALLVDMEVSAVEVSIRQGWVDHPGQQFFFEPLLAFLVAEQAEDLSVHLGPRFANAGLEPAAQEVSITSVALLSPAPGGGDEDIFSLSELHVNRASLTSV